MSKLGCMQAILTSEAPKLSRPNDWSPCFLDFLAKMLVKDPVMRATVDELLYHPFLRTACVPYKLSKVIHKADLLQKQKHQSRATKQVMFEQRIRARRGATVALEESDPIITTTTTNTRSRVDSDML